MSGASRVSNGPALVLFDLDDCLIDYAVAKERGKAKVGERVAQLGCIVDDFWLAYEAIEPVLFRRFAAGNLSRQEYRETRYARPLADLGVTIDAGVTAELNALYMQEANLGARPFEDSRPCLRRLRESGVVVGVLTNGPTDGQRTKLRQSGLEHDVDHVFISEEIGAGKPDPAAFGFALSHVGIPAEAAAMVGDSLELDILPAMAVGMYAVWIDRTGAAAERRSVPTIRELGALDELLVVLR
jgi:putative hydrolase of the HAD superfamily